MLFAIHNNTQRGGETEEVFHIEFTELTFDWIKAPAPPRQVRAEIRINEDALPFELKDLLVPGNAKHFNLILKVQQVDQDRSRANLITLTGSGRPVRPLDDHRSGKGILPQ